MQPRLTDNGQRPGSVAGGTNLSSRIQTRKLANQDCRTTSNAWSECSFPLAVLVKGQGCYVDQPMELYESLPGLLDSPCLHEQLRCALKPLGSMRLMKTVGGAATKRQSPHTNAQASIVGNEREESVLRRLPTGNNGSGQTVLYSVNKGVRRGKNRADNQVSAQGSN